MGDRPISFLGDEVINGDRAEAFVSGIEFEPLRVVLHVALVNGYVRRDELAGTVPDAPFDLDFYIRTVAQLLQDERLMRPFMAGTLREHDVW